MGWYRSAAGSISMAQGGAQRFLFASAGSATTLAVTAQANMSATLQLDRQTAAGFSSSIVGSLAGSLRWTIQPGNGTPAMDFGIGRYNDSGTFVDTPFSINRATGEVSTGSPAGLWIYDPTSSGGFAKLLMQTAGGVKTIRVGSSNSLEILNSAGSAAILSLTDIGTLTIPRGMLWAANNGDFGITSSGSTINSGTVSSVNVWNSTSIGANVYGQTVYDSAVGIKHQITVNTGIFSMKDGGQGTSQGGWVASSDRSVKDNLVPISNAMAMVRGWTGYTYDKLDMAIDGVAPRKAGLIAQDVERELPEAISYGDNDTRYLDHNGPIAVLTNALKEIDARLAALEALQ